MSTPATPRPRMQANLLERVVAAAFARRARASEGSDYDVAAQRRSSNRFAARQRLPRDVRETAETIAGVPVVRSSSGHPARGTVMHLHGGAYVLGLPRGWGRLAADGGPDVVSVDYRLAPEHPYPAAQHDALAVYRSLVGTVGADRLVVQGESAGGGLALTMLQGAAAAGLPMPAAVVALYPWTDVSLSGPSWTANRGRDLLTHSHIVLSASWYANGLDLQDPAISPLFGSFAGFPPTYLAVGTIDLTFDDSRAAAERMRSQGVEVQLDVYEGAVHGFDAVPLPMGRDCRARIRQFVDVALPGQPS